MAAGHRMIADDWGMFEEAVNQAGAGDLPQLLRSIRSMTTPLPATPPPVPTTPPPQGPLATPPPTPMDVQGPSPQKVKQEANNEEPILIRVGGKFLTPAHSVRPSQFPRTVVMLTSGLYIQEKPLDVPIVRFQHTTGIRSIGTRGNTTKCNMYNYSM